MIRIKSKIYVFSAGKIGKLRFFSRQLRVDPEHLERGRSQAGGDLGLEVQSAVALPRLVAPWRYLRLAKVEGVELDPRGGL